MALAWPIVLPSGAVKPATQPTTGAVTLALMYPRFLGVAADLTDHDDQLRSGIVLKALMASMWVVPMTGSPPMPMPVEKPEVTQLAHHLVGQRARLGHQADRPFTGDLLGDAHQSLARVMMPGQLGPMMRVLLPFRRCTPTRTLSPARDASVMTTIARSGVDGPDDGVREGGRHERDRRIGTRLLNGPGGLPKTSGSGVAVGVDVADLVVPAIACVARRRRCWCRP